MEEIVFYLDIAWTCNCSGKWGRSMDTDLWVRHIPIGKTLVKELNLLWLHRSQFLSKLGLDYELVMACSVGCLCLKSVQEQLPSCY